MDGKGVIIAIVNTSLPSIYRRNDSVLLATSIYVNTFLINNKNREYSYSWIDWLFHWNFHYFIDSKINMIRWLTWVTCCFIPFSLSFLEMSVWTSRLLIFFIYHFTLDKTFFSQPWIIWFFLDRLYYFPPPFFFFFFFSLIR
jgi:hypothetical protein